MLPNNVPKPTIKEKKLETQTENKHIDICKSGGDEFGRLRSHMHTKGGNVYIILNQES